MRSSILFFPFALVLVAGCAGSSSDEPTTNDSDFTSERPAPSDGDVPAFTDADQPEAYGARVRVSFAGGAVHETTTSPSRGTRPELPRPWTLGIAQSPAGRSVYASFGAANTKRFETGTYSCADADARIIEAEWNADGTAKPAREASSCTVVIDRIVAGPSKRYERAYGRFEAKAGGADGLSIDLRGTFLADFPIYE